MGGQTLQLAGLTCGVITAIDSHPPSTERLCETLAARGLAYRVRAQVGDTAHPGLLPDGLHLILDQPAMGRPDDVTVAIRECGFDLAGRLILPDEAWLDYFDTPMDDRIMELRGTCQGDTEAPNKREELSREPGMHRRYSDCYAYEFFVARRSAAGG